MATTKTTFTYRVTSVSEAGEGRVNVSLAQVSDDADSPLVYSNVISLNLTSDEAKAYWPGQEFTMTLTAV